MPWIPALPLKAIQRALIGFAGPDQLQVRADVDEAVERALTDSRRGWFGARVLRDLRGEQVRASIPLTTRYAKGVLPRFVAEIAAFGYVAPVDASVEPSADGLKQVPSRAGLRIDTGELHRKLERAVQNRSRPAEITKTIPPGPANPIKARWMAFNGSAGIHGIDPSAYSTIGTDASAGCVRMRIPDVISLYARAPVGTPVYVA